MKIKKINKIFFILIFIVSTNPSWAANNAYVYNASISKTIFGSLGCFNPDPNNPYIWNSYSVPNISPQSKLEVSTNCKGYALNLQVLDTDAHDFVSCPDSVVLDGQLDVTFTISDTEDGKSIKCDTTPASSNFPELKRRI